MGINGRSMRDQCRAMRGRGMTRPLPDRPAASVFPCKNANRNPRQGLQHLQTPVKTPIENGSWDGSHRKTPDRNLVKRKPPTVTWQNKYLSYDLAERTQRRVGLAAVPGDERQAVRSPESAWSSAALRSIAVGAWRAKPSARS